MFRMFLIFATVISLVFLVLGFSGRFMPLGESLAVFRLPNLLVAFVFALTLRKSRFFYLALIIIIISLISVGAKYIPQKIDEQNVYRIYQKNLSFRIKDTSDLKADILAPQKIDFITLQEVTTKNSELLSQLLIDFPYQNICPFAGVGDVAVLSRWPIIPDETKCFDKEGMTAMQVETPSGPLWLISIHMHWPYPYGQAAQTTKLLQHINSLEGPMLIAGDFNMVPWSYTTNAFERASDTHIARPIIHSLKLPLIPMTIPIDHVLVPNSTNAKTQRRGKKGSDHFGVVVEFNLP